LYAKKSKKYLSLKNNLKILFYKTKYEIMIARDCRVAEQQ